MLQEINLSMVMGFNYGMRWILDQIRLKSWLYALGWINFTADSCNFPSQLVVMRPFACTSNFLRLVWPQGTGATRRISISGLP